MTIGPGFRLGPYEIVTSLGAGGMGEVYKARDTRLDRDVAIKVLAPHLASNPALRERFEREARVISSLNHPNICALHDIGEVTVAEAVDDGGMVVGPEEGAPSSPLAYLVMEYLEGETLADRLAKSPLPLEQVLRHGFEIASALDTAHRAGIVHRDLKPANVMLTRSGAKLLDFGLAKYSQRVTAIASSVVPTEHKPLTQEGTVLGTFQYMAPEQLAGEEADARTDIFALGTVLYEMVTGVRAFQGKNRTSLIGAIVSGEPRPVSALQPLTPPALEHVIRKCLAKDSEDRWQSAHDIAGELRWISEAGSQAGVAVPLTARRKSRERIAWALCAVAVLVAVVFAIGMVQRGPSRQQPVHLTLLPPLGTSIRLTPDLLGMALSPDGSRLAFSAAGVDGKRSLWIQSFSEEGAKRIGMSDGASYPFWSPDGRQVAFFADGMLKKVDLAGGSPQDVAEAPSGRGGSWSEDGTILFVPNTEAGIYKVSSRGGSVTAVIADEENSSCRWPHFLPGGKRFLYVTTGDELHAGSLDGGSPVVITTNASNAVYVEPGYLVYGRGHDLVMQPFDASDLEVTGEPVAIFADRVLSYEPKVLSFFTIAGSSLVFTPTRNIPDQMAWFGRNGQHLESFGPEGEIPSANLSADDRRIAFILLSTRSDKGDLWIRDLGQNRDVRLTYVDGLFDRLAWSPDGSEIALTYRAKITTDIYLAKLSGGEMIPLIESSAFMRNVSWLPGREGLVFAEQNAVTDFDVWIWFFENRERRLLFSTPFYEGQTSVSPDGRLLSYSSTESGKGEIYIRSLDGSASQLQISNGGGRYPFWRKDGREIYYTSGDGHVMAVTVTGGSAFETGVPVRLFQLPEGAQLMDATSDGERFLLTVWTEEPPVEAFEVVLNWQTLVAERFGRR